MGLPSRTLWANGNICKDSQGNYYIGNPTDVGCYDYWADIIGYRKEEGHDFNVEDYVTTPGAQVTTSLAFNDAEHDIAVARIGGGWRLPTKAEMQELANSEYCSWEWTTIDGTNGYLITSIINGNTMFLPASGYRAAGHVYYFNSYCTYWGSSLANKNEANLYFFSSSSHGVTYKGRAIGGTFRAVI